MNTTSCSFYHIGLIVTGKTEEQHIHKLFRSIMEIGICSFRVLRRIGQRDPITSTQRKLTMVGSGKTIPDKDTSEIGLPARAYLSDSLCHLVVLIDDLERHRLDYADQVFDRYRMALDTILRPAQQHRAAVHFFVTMIEAYYLADANAVNLALDLEPPLQDHKDDVETIPNPKSKLKSLYPYFDEIADGGKILDHLDMEHILSHPDRCAWLRTLFLWCLNALEQDSQYKPQFLSLREKLHLTNGNLSPITQIQCETE